MHKIDGANNVNGEFVDYNFQSDVPGTVVTSAWMNAIQREFLAILAFAGLSPDKLDDNQVIKSLRQMFGVLGGGNVWQGTNRFLQTVLKADGTTEADPFLQVDVAVNGASKRWCVFKLALGSGAFARLLISGGGSISLTINAAWSNGASTWTPDVAAMACVRVMANSNGFQVYSYTSPGGAAFSDATFTASGVVLLGTAIGYTNVQTQYLFVPAQSFTSLSSANVTGGPSFIVSTNPVPVWKAGDSVDGALASVAHIPEGATVTGISWLVYQPAGGTNQGVSPSVYLVTQSTANANETSLQIHAGPGITVVGSSGLQWYPMTMASSTIVMPAAGYLYVGIGMPRTVNGAGNGFALRGVRVTYQYNAIRAPV
ncbi:hypothetical protein F0U62_18690 [Cystobacter fuscus]|uniref:hypothetical protein n=1 Tax=Cystobacter fuscus TaxID=43 RepID=UPI002B2F07C2|nr:hypothetical protein F0U62_18690 [Cystobacter fuscus]